MPTRIRLLAKIQCHLYNLRLVSCSFMLSRNCYKFVQIIIGSKFQRFVTFCNVEIHQVRRLVFDSYYQTCSVPLSGWKCSLFRITDWFNFIKKGLLYHHVMTISNELGWFWKEPLVSTWRFDQYALIVFWRKSLVFCLILILYRVFLSMPGYSRNQNGLACKVVTIFPRNENTPHPVIQATIILSDANNGSMKAVSHNNDNLFIITGIYRALLYTGYHSALQETEQ